MFSALQPTSPVVLYIFNHLQFNELQCSAIWCNHVWCIAEEPRDGLGSERGIDRIVGRWHSQQPDDDDCGEEGEEKKENDDGDGNEYKEAEKDLYT